MMEETLLASLFLCFVLSSSLTLFSFQFLSLFLTRWKGTEKIINWLFWAEYFSNVILSLLGIFVGSSELLIHGDLSHLDLLTLSELSLQCIFTSTPFKCLLASCSWNFFSCPGVPILLGPLWCYGSSVYQGTWLLSTRNIHTSLIPQKFERIDPCQQDHPATGHSVWGLSQVSVFCAHQLREKI